MLPVYLSTSRNIGLSVLRCWKDNSPPWAIVLLLFFMSRCFFVLWFFCLYYDLSLCYDFSVCVMVFFFLCYDFSFCLLVISLCYVFIFCVMIPLFESYVIVCHVFFVCVTSWCFFFDSWCFLLFKSINQSQWQTVEIHCYNTIYFRDGKVIIMNFVR